ncbi:MAG: hypothetical protein Q8R55_02805 [Candidatus Taylorbacteria bacterium]|nr:hypothetical protein [Candidatus Taylorbacteria bacterium]
MTKQNMVWIEAICACMWGGKSEEVASRCKRAKFARKKILVILPIIDKREERNLETMLREPTWLGNYEKLHIHRVSSFAETKKLLSDIDPDILVLDEIHMFGLWPADFVSELRFVQKYQEKNLRIIVSSLDMDFQGRSFEAISLIMAMAHDVRKLSHAICKKCENTTAYMTYKIPKNNIVNPKRIQVGGEGDYEPRCWECYISGEN